MTSRRQFLGAAAAALALPGTEVSGAESDGSDEVETYGIDSRGPPKGYPREEAHGEYFGMMEIPEYDDAMRVELGVYPHQVESNISLNVTFSGISVGPALDPADARELGEALVEAADEVEQWQATHWTDKMHQQAAEVRSRPEGR